MFNLALKWLSVATGLRVYMPCGVACMRYCVLTCARVRACVRMCGRVSAYVRKRD